MILRSLFVIVLFAMLKPLMAEHLPGGSITYTCLGGNYFEIKLQLMRECSGFAMIPQDLHFTNTCGVVFDVSDIPPVLVDHPSQICPAEQGNSTCSGGVLPGYELYEFTTELYLSPCSYWTIFWSICCRQTTLNVQSIPGLYIETQIDNVADSCNSSPIFDHNSVPRVCVGQPVNYNAGATDPDGTRLEYSFIDARFASPTPVSVNYVFPNYGGEPIAGMALDQYGQITFTPTEQGYIVVVVKIDEYNADDEWIGSVMRDFPFFVTTCEDLTPAADSGALTATSGSASIEGDRALRFCTGSSACATIEFTDPDDGQTLSIWSNVDSILPGASIETSGTDPLTVNICWNEQEIAAGSYSFVITVMDDACPIMGARSFVYTVDVAEPPYAGLNGTAIACELALPFTMLDSLEGAPPTGGSWTDPQGAAHWGTFTGSIDPPGTYIYSVTEGACTGTAELLVEFLPVDDSLCILLAIADHERVTMNVHPNPSTGLVILEGVISDGSPLLLFDVHGRLVWQVAIAKDEAVQITLPQELSDGIYSLIVNDASGMQFRSRLILQR